jgi:hypothetical protein
MDATPDQQEVNNERIEEAKRLAELIKEKKFDEVVDVLTVPEGDGFGEAIMTMIELIHLISHDDLETLRQLINSKFCQDEEE